MIENGLADTLLSFFERYLAFYKDFLLLETTKYQDMRENRLEKLSQHVKDEEAYSLKARGLEMERDRLVLQASSSDTTFRGLIPLFDQSRQERAKGLYDELYKVMTSIKETNRGCNYLTELKLHRVQIELRKMKNSPEMQKEYNSRAKECKKAFSIISRKA